MSDEFVINNDKLDIIAQEFKVDRNSIDKLYHDFEELQVQIKDHYLAHISRVLEKYFKQKTGNREFVIECKPFRIIPPGSRGAVSYYNKLNKFTINYNNELPERKKRNNIAHELGHLYLYARYYSKTADEYSKYEKTTEPLSSIFGLFTISDKNHFYETLSESGRNHDNWQSILDDFKNICPLT